MDDLKKEVRRLPPCPAYDVEGMESWLTGLAREEGLLLIYDGIFAGVATFELGEPRQEVKYRLEAAPKPTGLLADNNGDPDPEAVELAREYHWEYVAKRGDFYIYRTEDPSARELNTDPEVQALAIRAVRKRQAGSLFYLLFWLVLYPIASFLGNSGLLRVCVDTGTWFLLWAAALVVWALIDSIAELLHLNRLMKKLRSGRALEENKPWRGRTVPYQVKNFLLIVLCAAWAVVGLNRWAAAVEAEHRPTDYHGTPPFATLADFGSGSYEPTMVEWNGVREWSDWLAPYNMKWSEYATVTLWEGEYRVNGSLRVEYHEMAAPFLARWMAWELERARYTKEEWDPAPELPELDVDYVSVFHDLFPTVVLQKGNVVLKASFYQYQSSEGELALEDWVSILAESLGA